MAGDTFDLSYINRVRRIRQSLRLAKVPLMTLASDLELSPEKLSDGLYFREAFDEALLEELENYARDNTHEK